MIGEKSIGRALLIAIVTACAGDARAIDFELTFSKKLRSEPFTGRVIIILSDDSSGEPRKAIRWTDPPIIFGQDVREWKAGEPLTISKPTGFPCELKDLPAGKYRIQAVMHTNPDVPHGGTAPGNLYSKTIEKELDPTSSDSIKLAITKRVPKPRSEALGARTKVVEMRSRLLSKFHGRDIFLRAAVVVPEVYEKQPDQKFPAIYVIPGFGGDHIQTAAYAMLALGRSDVPFVRIALDATCGLGHHVFADSDNNGPCGTALTEEFIPHLEKEFRLIPEASARFLTGHSSGGWGSLWVMINHPHDFAGTWSTSPDSVDFHDFSGINLYDPKSNLFTNKDSQLRPIMRRGDQIVLYLRDFVRLEEAIGPGGQIHSFEAVFSPRGKDGRPKPLFDRKTGRIDPKVVESWRRYDIVDKLDREWPTLGPKLAGKMTVIMGSEDNFYLEGAIRRLRKRLKQLGSDARIIIEPGKDHGSIMMTKPFRAIMTEMGERFRNNHPDAALNDRESKRKTSP